MPGVGQPKFDAADEVEHLCTHDARHPYIQTGTTPNYFCQNVLFPNCLTIHLTLQRYLMKYLVKAPFPVREIGAVMALLHVSHQLQDLIRMQDFERQHHFQEPPDL